MLCTSFSCEHTTPCCACSFMTNHGVHMRNANIQHIHMDTAVVNICSALSKEQVGVCVPFGGFSHGPCEICSKCANGFGRQRTVSILAPQPKHSATGPEARLLAET